MTKRNKNKLQTNNSTDDTLSPDKQQETRKKQRVEATASEMNSDDHHELDAGQGGSEITLLELHRMIKEDIMNASKSTNSRIDNIAQNIEKSIEKLQHEVQEVKSSQQFISDEFENVKISVDDQKTLVSSMKLEITELKNDQAQAQQHIEELNYELNKIKQCSIESHLLISNVVQLVNENLDNLFGNILSALGLSCSSHEIIGITRLTSSNARGVPPILVRFINVSLKDKIMKMGRAKPLSCIDIGLNIDQRIYFNHRLTSLNQRLLGIARKFRNDNNYKFVWFSNGSVFIKKDENSNALKISDVHDLPDNNC
ncbi:uncharacterized protein LOC129752590 [Uranotaenia lowii]|uniref:uncharacterized protein LOC129752590 n=2 Tax=Uranotaenia lowii TaxID=190385 RepID=UPI00247A8A04|nr:uncharacterized protein LOC129752590 [Uranotaenia lowii]